MRTKDNEQQTITMPFEGEVITNDDGAKGKRHPNFIESNTQKISLEELTERNIIPTFSDNSLTISHQNFISAVTKVASNVFGELTPVELSNYWPYSICPAQESIRAYGKREDRILPTNGFLLSCGQFNKNHQRTNCTSLYWRSEGVQRGQIIQQEIGDEVQGVRWLAGSCMLKLNADL